MAKIKKRKTDGNPSISKKGKNTGTIDFYDALKKVEEGKSISKLEWRDSQIYFCRLSNGLLTINNATGTHAWVISEADMIGEDYYVIN